MDMPDFSYFMADAPARIAKLTQLLNDRKYSEARKLAGELCSDMGFVAAYAEIAENMEAGR